MCDCLARHCRAQDGNIPKTQKTTHFWTRALQIFGCFRKTALHIKCSFCEKANIGLSLQKEIYPVRVISPFDEPARVKRLQGGLRGGGGRRGAKEGNVNNIFRRSRKSHISRLF